MGIKIKDLIAALRKPQTTSADLARALAAAEREAEAIEAEREEAVRAYNAGLLDLDEPQLKALTARRQAAEVEQDRIRHLVASLTARIAELREAEQEAAFQAERAAIEAEAERVAKLVRERYPQISRDLVGLLSQLSRMESTVSQFNDKARKLDREGDVLSPVERRAVPHTQNATGHLHSVLTNTFMQVIPDFAPGWNCSPYTHRYEVNFSGSHGTFVPKIGGG